MNIIDFLKENDIEYWERGKNVSAGYINIQCLFCGDDSNHLGIRLSDLKCNCWKCGRKSIVNIIKTIVNCTYREAKAIVQTFDSAPSSKLIEEAIVRKQQLILPGSDIFPSIHLAYLKDRGFNPKKTIEKYKLKACYRSGRYKYRIIIPVFMNKRLVYFTARDVTDEAYKPYDACPDNQAVIDPGEVIFNFDSVDKFGDAILTEGPFDVMRIGDGAFCFMGVSMPPKRLLKVAEKRINNLYIFYDQDPTGNREAKIKAKLLSPFVKKIQILHLRKSTQGIYLRKGSKIGKLKIDPAEISQEYILQLRKELGFKN